MLFVVLLLCVTAVWFCVKNEDFVFCVGRSFCLGVPVLANVKNIILYVRLLGVTLSLTQCMLFVLLLCVTAVWFCIALQVLKVMAKKLVRKALEMLRKLATVEVQDEEVR